MKKNQMEILELKIQQPKFKKCSELALQQNGGNHKGISELEDRTVETTQSEKKK